MKRTNYITAYELHARYIPAILTSVPFLMLGYFLLRAEDTRDILNFLLSLKFLGGLSVSFVMLYFYAQLIRTTGKYFEKRYFHDAQGFPTTYFMLYSNQEYSDALKDAYRHCVKKELGFSLLSRSEEESNPSEAMRRLNDVTKQIILRVGEGALVGKHNQWYGFFRNLIGGTVYALAGSSLNVLIGYCVLHHLGLVLFSSALFIVYGMLLLCRRPLMIQHAEAYARQLHAEFMKKQRR